MIFLAKIIDIYYCEENFRILTESPTVILMISKFINIFAGFKTDAETELNICYYC